MWRNRGSSQVVAGADAGLFADDLFLLSGADVDVLYEDGPVITVTRRPDSGAIPEPHAAALAAIALMSLASWTRRRRIAGVRGFRLFR
ncbi:MAG: hypothetical protein CMJ18_18455 [Phycisphaeraceae bacterium]|nr:hypothetical protein [Phycisphaeraceae bacterium]